MSPSQYLSLIGSKRVQLGIQCLGLEVGEMPMLVLGAVLAALVFVVAVYMQRIGGGGGQDVHDRSNHQNSPLNARTCCMCGHVQNRRPHASSQAARIEPAKFVQSFTSSIQGRMQSLLQGKIVNFEEKEHGAVSGAAAQEAIDSMARITATLTSANLSPQPVPAAFSDNAPAQNKLVLEIVMSPKSPEGGLLQLANGVSLETLATLVADCGGETELFSLKEGTHCKVIVNSTGRNHQEELSHVIRRPGIGGVNNVSCSHMCGTVSNATGSMCIPACLLDSQLESVAEAVSGSVSGSKVKLKVLNQTGNPMVKGSRCGLPVSGTDGLGSLQVLESGVKGKASKECFSPEIASVLAALNVGPVSGKAGHESTTFCDGDGSGSEQEGDQQKEDFHDSIDLDEKRKDKKRKKSRARKHKAKVEASFKVPATGTNEKIETVIMPLEAEIGCICGTSKGGLHSSRCPYPFTCSGSMIQRKIKEQYEELVRCNANKTLTLAQVGRFTTCLIEAKAALQQKSENIQRKFAIAKSLLTKAEKSSFDRLCGQIYRLEIEKKKLEEDTVVYNRLQEQLRLSPAYQKMLDYGRSHFELHSNTGQLIEKVDAQDNEISFEELLAQEKKDVFWQKHGASRPSIQWQKQRSFDERSPQLKAQKAATYLA